MSEQSKRNIPDEFLESLGENTFHVQVDRARSTSGINLIEGADQDPVEGNRQLIE